MRACVLRFVIATVLLLLPGTGFAACPDPVAVAAARAQVAQDCDCAGAATHGAFVSCASGVARARSAAGLLPRECVSAVVRCAARSTCGKPGAVACCRTSASGTTKCSIKRAADKCRAPAGGSACVSPFASCCDACGTAGCAAPVTTTTTTSTTTTTLPPCGTGSASGCCVGDFDSQPGGTPPGTCAYEVSGPECGVRIFQTDCQNRGFAWTDARCSEPLCGQATGCCNDVPTFLGVDLGTFGTPLDPQAAAETAAACELPQIGGTASAGRCP